MRGQSRGLRRYLPFLGWLAHYRRADLPSDLVAGLVTAIMLIPQSMAYAQLAGLPVAELDAVLNPRKAPTFEAAAASGVGVFETLKAIAKLMIDAARERDG